MHSYRRRLSVRAAGGTVMLLATLVSGCAMSFDLPAVSINFSLIGVFVNVVDSAVEIGDEQAAKSDDNGWRDD